MNASSIPTELDRLLIEHACTRLVVEFSNALDEHDSDRILTMWQDDGIWESPKGRAVGKSAMQMVLGSVPRILERHLVSNVIVRAIDRDHAEGSGRLTYYRTSGEIRDDVAQMQGVTLIADHFDSFVRTPQGWKFARRKTVYVLRRSAEP